MTPAIPPGYNVIYRKPVDWNEAKDGPCDDVHVIKKNGYITSVWKPSEDELKELNSGGLVLMVFVGENFPPVSLGVVGKLKD